MSSVQLLDKTRKIGKLLHNNNSSKVVFNDICSVMREILNSNVLVISRKGKILGVSGKEGIVIEELLQSNVGSFIDPLLNERLLAVLSTKENVNLTTLGFDVSEEKEFLFGSDWNFLRRKLEFLSKEIFGLPKSVRTGLWGNFERCSDPLVNSI